MKKKQSKHTLAHILNNEIVWYFSEEDLNAEFTDQGDCPIARMAKRYTGGTTKPRIWIWTIEFLMRNNSIENYYIDQFWLNGKLSDSRGFEYYDYRAMLKLFIEGNLQEACIVVKRGTKSLNKQSKT
jgi:hypothetical protein